MKRLVFVEIIALVFLLMVPAITPAQTEQEKTDTPPVSQPLVREGDFAVKLAEALKLGITDSETQAESMLGSVGIAPRNGWIADYPITPDIIGEIKDSVTDAADSNRLEIGKDEALKAVDDISANLGLDIRPYTSGDDKEAPTQSYDNYPNPPVVNNYYYNYGPPVVTYYPPPPDFYYLYTWVPYPFWWFDFWFPGFYILVDFHKIVIVHKKVVVITNHFNDVTVHKVFRIDPVQRFHGKTFAGIGVPRIKGFVPTGVRRGPETIFNRNRQVERDREIRGGERRFRQPQGRGTIAPPPGTGRRTGPPPGVRREFSPPPAEQRRMPPSPEGQMKARPSLGGERKRQIFPGGEKPMSPFPGGGR